MEKSWKPGIGEIVKASRGIAPEPHTGVCSAPYEPPAVGGQRAAACWVMACGHKTQSFMKNGDQQKCLDKGFAGYL